MEVFLVGGAVRDALLGRPVSERDWVVVGATAEEMLADGYRQVGRDFPVFLHPETSEEYALARTERKIGPGHQGFEVHAEPSVTLEEDLIRRDLTINAIARSADGELIDPLDGQSDLDACLLRHVSAAFSEDPLRVFRVARFAAVLPDFSVADETRALMRNMSDAGALAELSAERIWAELVKALAGPAPERFIEELRQCSALAPWFAEFESCEPASPAGLEAGAQRYAAYVSSLDAESLSEISARLKAPRAYARLAGWIVRYGPVWRDWHSADAARLYRALSECRAFKPNGELQGALAVGQALGGKDLDALRQVVASINSEVRVDKLQAEGHSGAALGRALDDARVRQLALAQAGSRSPERSP